MLKINEIQPGQSYACKFKVQTELNDLGEPIPNLNNNSTLKIGDYESFGVLLQRDCENNIVKILDHPSQMQFIVPFSDIWDIDTVEWVDPLDP